jgi:superfamily II DNA or RNA helicase
MVKGLEPVKIRFVAGTLELVGLRPEDAPPGCVWDGRSGSHRAPALAYASVVYALRERGLAYEDEARKYAELETGLKVRREPRPFQRAALKAWWAAKGRGHVVLPTGSGKSYVALMAIDKVRRSALIVAPTLDLVRQWYDLLRASFRVPVGVIGGGDYRVEDLTVTTYDSAHIHMENLGARFGVVVFDECHHLPSEAYALAAESCLAPFRLGLTATPERQDGRDILLDGLIGPEVYREDIVDLSGSYLAEYETIRIVVDLSPEERAEHDAARECYRSFVARQGIRMSSPEGWGLFIQRSAISEEGRRAMKAYQRQRKLAFAAPAKLEYLEHLLQEHRRDRAILFTQDNATCYEISRRFLVPAITHQTKVSERSEILAGLNAGTYNAVVTSKVLNEGVDVPEANVAVVVSGSGSVREHVQRLGRVLRKRGDKRAILYEIITADTTETHTSRRRREHSAYR